MGLLSRMPTVIKAKMSRLLDHAEDPRETLDYSYEKQLEMVRNVKRGIVEVVTSKRRLEIQVEQARQGIAKLDAQARQAMAAGREDLARVALERKQALLSQIEGLESQITGLEQEQQKLTLTEARLQAKVEAFRTKKETIKAQYSAAEAQVRIGEALSGISEEMGELGMAVERAENKTEQMRARASAIDALAAEGVLDDPTRPSDTLEAELQKISSSQNVDAELEAMKHQLPPGTQKQLGSGS